MGKPALRRSDLETFANWFLEQRVGALEYAEVFDYGPVKSAVLCREPPFQVELFIMRAGKPAVAPHRHPNVDSIEICGAGHIAFNLNGRDYPISPGAQLHVGPEDWHSVSELNESVSFYSVQQWLNGKEPSSVGLDWEGTILSLAGLEHIKLLRQRGKWWRVKR